MSSGHEPPRRVVRARWPRRGAWSSPGRRFMSSGYESPRRVVRLELSRAAVHVQWQRIAPVRRRRAVSRAAVHVQWQRIAPPGRAPGALPGGSSCPVATNRPARSCAWSSPGRRFMSSGNESPRRVVRLELSRAAVHVQWPRIAPPARAPGALPGGGSCPVATNRPAGPCAARSPGRRFMSSGYESPRWPVLARWPVPGCRLRPDVLASPGVTRSPLVKSGR